MGFLHGWVLFFLAFCATAGVGAASWLGYGWLSLFTLLLGVMFVAVLHVAFHVRLSREEDSRDRAIRQRLNGLVIGFAAFFSLLLSVLIPPMQSPDEMAHVGRAYGVLNNEVLVRDLGDRANQHVDQAFQQYFSIWGSSLPFQPQNQVTQELEKQTRTLSWQDREVLYYNPAAGYFPALYLPSSIGIAMGRWMQQPPWVAASWARFGMWSTAVIIFGLALAIVQFGHRLMAAAMLLPMTLAQTGSANLDAVTISGAFLLIALFTWELSPAGRASLATIRIWAATASWLLLMLLALAKPVFLVLLLVPAFQAWQWREARRLLLAGSTLVLVLLWQLHVSQAFSNPNSDLQGSISARLLDSVLSPWQTFALFGLTFEEKSAFYWDSMLGILGWLDTPLTKSTYISASVLLAASLFSDMLAPARLSAMARLVLGLTVAAYVMGTMLLLWVTWTPVNHPFIEGVQGRYFLPLLPAVAVVVNGLLSPWAQHRHMYDRVLLACFCIYMLVITVDVPVVLVSRYWL